MVRIEKVNAGWKVSGLGATGWMTNQEHEEMMKALDEMGASGSEVMVDDVWMMYVDARWALKKPVDHRSAIAIAAEWLKKMRSGC